MQLDRIGTEILDRAECFQLLATGSIAHVGLSMQALPVVIPVNYAVDGDQIVIRTSAGSPLSAALRHSVVAVEVDDHDPASHTGWSVLVRGTSRVIDDPGEIARVSTLPLLRFASEGADRWIGVSIDLISGRRTRPTHELELASSSALAHRN